jgi:hypothetical protein
MKRNDAERILVLLRGYRNVVRRDVYMLASKIEVEGTTLSTTLAKRSGQRLKPDDSVERKYLDLGNHSHCYLSRNSFVQS